MMSMKALLVLMITALFLALAATPLRAAGTVGDGTPASCTSTALQAAINAGNGLITFNCGGAVTIPVTATLNVDAQSGITNITVDGGGLVTLDGQNARRIFFQRTWGNNGSTLTLQNLTLRNGRASGSNDNANGGAVQSINQSISQASPPNLFVNNVTFQDNASNLTSFSSGNAYDYGGGAIYSGAGIVDVQNSTFSNNDANNAAGGAIHILRSDLTISTSTFTNSSAIGSVPANSQGGAIYVDGYRAANHNLTITDSTFTGNTAYNSGGAIYINMYDNTNQFSVNRSSFFNNAVTGGSYAQGGAISGGSTSIGGATGNASISITNSTFSGNSVQKSGSPLDGSGGALAFAQRAVITIANSTFSGNSALGSSFNANGGAIYIINNTTQFEIMNSTIANNFAGWVGGGISSSNNGRLRNSLIANNSADNGPNTWDIQQQCSAELVDGGNNLQYPPRNSNPNFFNEITCFAGKSAINQINLPDFRDPLLDVLADYGGPTQTRALLTGSPAIDYGSGSLCAASPVNNLDQRGQTRPIDGDGLNGAQCDSGAFEFVPNQPPFAPTLLTPSADAALTAIPIAFTWNPGAFAIHYHLQVDNDSDFSSPNADISNISTTSYSLPYLGVGSYYWRVESVNSFGSAWSASRIFDLVSPAGAAPSRHYFTSLPVVLTWNRVSGVLGYWIQIADNPAFANPVVDNATLLSSTLMFNATLGDGIYYWRVRAKTSATTWGTWSAAESFVVDLP